MALKQKIQQDLNEAMKSKEELRTSVLRLLLSAILNKEKEKRYKIAKSEPEIDEKELLEKSQLTDEEVIEVISSESKKRKEAIIEFTKGKREDLAEKEKKELEILKKYLPEQIPEEEIRRLAKEAIDKVGAQNLKDMGKVMSELMPKLKGKADSGLVSKIVKEFLTPHND